jgi:hypothetical protein
MWQGNKEQTTYAKTVVVQQEPAVGDQKFGICHRIQMQIANVLGHGQMQCCSTRYCKRLGFCTEQINQTLLASETCNFIQQEVSCLLFLDEVAGKVGADVAPSSVYNGKVLCRNEKPQAFAFIQVPSKRKCALKTQGFSTAS